MDTMKPLEDQDDAQKASVRPFFWEWAEAWKQLEERVRQRPELYVSMAIALGYVLQIVPVRSLLVLGVKLCLRLALPVLFLFCAFQLTKDVGNCAEKRI
jgi:hypothetical protein